MQAMNFSNLTLEFQLEYNSLLDFRMKSTILAPDIILNLDQEFRMVSFRNITLKSISSLPIISRHLQVEFIFKPLRICKTQTTTIR